jgi:asparagine synthase (glutamine-hydrolysing)
MFSPRGTIDEDALARATRRLTHRGPDGQRWWVSEDRRVGLGHTRLSIIDLATGDQPISSEDGSRRVVVNGEFYDFERIRRGLERQGHRFRTGSDSEIALHLYEDASAGCLEQLRGEFALVIWDAQADLLFAARDRFGIKPLFYAMLGETLFLASEAKALFAAGVPARWDREAFYQVCHLAVPHPDRSLFEGIRQVPAGHYLVARGGRVELSRYWDFDYPPADSGTQTASDAESAERFRQALDEAVFLRLRADVPVGCYLSGGLDSCAVLGLAAPHCSRPIRAFTLTFDRPDYDEGPIAEAMARHAGAEYHPIAVTQTELAHDFVEAVAQSETLMRNAHGVAKYRLSRAVREAGYKVVLTGEGADEVLAGYPHFRRDMLLYDTQGQDAEEARHLLDELSANNPVSRGLLLPEGETAPVAQVKQTLGFVPSWIETNASTAFKLRQLLADDFASEFAGRDSYQEFLAGLDIAGQLSAREPVHQSLYLWSKSWLPNYVLTVLGDRMEMAHSVEGRVPFLDHHVVEQVRSMPVSLKIRGRIEKFILREAARPVLTAAVYARHKHPFLSPPASLAPAGRLHALMHDTLRGPALADVPFYSQAKVINLLDRLPELDDATRVALDPVLMDVLSACVLQERYGL